MDMGDERRRLIAGIAVVCWTWALAHVANESAAAWHSERELRSEARVLLEMVCSLPRSFPAGSSLIRCDEARAVMARGPIAFVAAERAAAALIKDLVAAARHEVGALLRAFGFAGALLSAAVVVSSRLSHRVKLWGLEQNERVYASDVYRTRGAMYLPMGTGKVAED